MDVIYIFLPRKEILCIEFLAQEMPTCISLRSHRLLFLLISDLFAFGNNIVCSLGG